MLSAKPPSALGLLEHRAADRDRHHPEGARAGGAASRPGRAQGRHGRLLVLRLPRRRLALPADEHLRRRLGRTAGRGRRGCRSVSVCQGDVRNTPVELQEIKYPVLIETHALRADSGGDGTHPRRARRRADLSAAAEVQGQHQSRPHPRSALGPARRQARRDQRLHHPARRRQRDARSRRRPRSRSRPATA